MYAVTLAIHDNISHDNFEIEIQLEMEIIQNQKHVRELFKFLTGKFPKFFLFKFKFFPGTKIIKNISRLFYTFSIIFIHRSNIFETKI